MTLKPGKPARMTLTLYSRSFESEEARELWYKERKSLIERSYTARYKHSAQRAVDCTYDSTCSDAEEEFAKQKAAAFKELERQNANTRIAAFTPAQKPAGAANTNSAPLIVDSQGQKLCLVRAGKGQWKSRPCNAPKRTLEMRKVTVDGTLQCLFQLDRQTWQTRPCPN